MLQLWFYLINLYGSIIGSRQSPGKYSCPIESNTLLPTSEEACKMFVLALALSRCQQGGVCHYVSATTTVLLSISVGFCLCAPSFVAMGNNGGHIASHACFHCLSCKWTRTSRGKCSTRNTADTYDFLLYKFWYVSPYRLAPRLRLL